MAEPTIVEVLHIRPLEPGAFGGSRHAVVRYDDGAVEEALRWYDDEILFCEGDFVGRTRADMIALKFARDRDHLQS